MLGSACASRAGEGAPPSRTFPGGRIQSLFRRGAETSTRGACAPRHDLAPDTPVFQQPEGSIAQYEKIIRLCDQVDFVTQDLAIGILGDEQEHRRAFLGYLTEFERARDS
jgi:hypothetical protein